jgi:glycosyltransferase involved in cell wall biosynthesis
MALDLAFVLTHNRHDILRKCVDAISVQVDKVCVIDNASTPPIVFNDLRSIIHTLIYDDEQPPNLARLMNIGFDWAQSEACDDINYEWNVAVLCDDVIAPQGWFSSVKSALRSTCAVAGSTHQSAHVTQILIKTEPDSDIYNRMQGSACVFKGEAGLRADERMRWWWQDTDLDWQARKAGGMVISPGPVAVNERPNDFTNAKPELATQAGKDREVFIQKWGRAPW